MNPHTQQTTSLKHRYQPTPRRPYVYIRQSLQRLSRLVHPRRAATFPLRSPRIALRDLSDTSLSASIDDDDESLKTTASTSTWGIDDPSQRELPKPPSIITIGSSTGDLPLPIGRGQDGSSLSSSLPKKQQQNQHKSKTGEEIAKISIEFTSGDRITWTKPRKLIEALPEDVMKAIWRKVVVDERSASDDGRKLRLMVCNCYHCNSSSLTALQPPLTLTSRSIRSTALPIFYAENLFRFPLSHPSTCSVRQWLSDIGPENRKFINHLELAWWNAERAIESLPKAFGLGFVKSVDGGRFVEEVGWDDGQVGEVEWCVFGAWRDAADGDGGESEAEEKATKGEEKSDDDEEATTVRTSILFPHSEVGELEFEASSDQLTTASTASTSSDDDLSAYTNSEEEVLPVIPRLPPKLHLKRPNGEEFGSPRWSFAGKFNEHVAKRLASLSRDSAYLPRKPVFVSRAPRVVVASDEGEGDDDGSHKEDESDALSFELMFEKSDGDLGSVGSSSGMDLY